MQLPFTSEEMTMTLYDVLCILHIPIWNHLLDNNALTKPEPVEMIVEVIGSNPTGADQEVEMTK